MERKLAKGSGAVRKNSLESALVRSFNSYFQVNQITALAYRYRQSRYAAQPCDVIVDSADPEYYLGIEAKSVTATTDSLRWTSHFTNQDRIWQTAEFFRATGRAGYLAVEVRDRRHKLYLVPWHILTQAVLAGVAGLPVDQVRTYPSCRVDGGVYALSELFPLSAHPTRQFLKTTRLSGFRKKRQADI